MKCIRYDLLLFGSQFGHVATLVTSVGLGEEQRVNHIDEHANYAAIVEHQQEQPTQIEAEQQA